MKNINVNEKEVSVQVSNQLIDTLNASVKLSELKLLFLLLSKINTHKPEEKSAVISKTEYLNCTNKKDIMTGDVKKMLTSLAKNVAYLKEDDVNEVYDIAPLFSLSRTYLDNSGKRLFELVISNESSSLFFNIEKIGYQNYVLNDVVKLKTKTALLLYIYVIRNSFRKEWSVNLEDIRKSLKFTAVNKTNSDFILQYFNPAVKEIKEKTGLTFDISFTKYGLAYKKINFTCESAKNKKPADNTPSNAEKTTVNTLSKAEKATDNISTAAPVVHNTPVTSTSTEKAAVTPSSSLDELSSYFRKFAQEETKKTLKKNDKCYVAACFCEAGDKKYGYKKAEEEAPICIENTIATGTSEVFNASDVSGTNANVIIELAEICGNSFSAQDMHKIYNALEIKYGVNRWSLVSNLLAVQYSLLAAREKSLGKPITNRIDTFVHMIRNS